MDKMSLRSLYRGRPVPGGVSRKIVQALMEEPSWKEASLVLLYVPLKDEVDVSPLLDTGRHIALPFITAGGEMEFALYDGRLEKGRLGFMEPVTKEAVAPGPSALLVAPGLAFSRDAYRLGRGGGFYDRYLAGHDVRAIGLCPSDRLIDRLPIDDHDRPFDLVITD